MTKHRFAFSILFVAILISLPLAFAGFMFWKLNFLQSELAALEQEISVLDSKQRNIKALKNVLNELGDRTARLDNLFIDEKSLVRFIEDLEELAKESSVELKVDSAVLPQSSEELGPTFEFTASGEFRNLFKYERLLENSPYQLVFDRVETSRNLREGTKKSPSWSAHYKLKVISYLF